MLHCPNINHPEWKNMVEVLGEPLSYYYYNLKNGDFLSAKELLQASYSITDDSNNQSSWSRSSNNGFEVSSKGTELGKKFSAFNAKLSDGRTIEEAYQLDIKGYRNELPTNSSASARAKMIFSYNGNNRPDVTAKTTFDAVFNGERTATTRYESDGNIQYFNKLKEGDIITFIGADNKEVNVVVTKPLTKLTEDVSAEEWSKKEGWSVEYFNSKVKPKLQEAYQIEYKLYSNPNTTYKQGKGKAPILNITKEEQYSQYKALWKQYIIENPELFNQLKEASNGKVLTDRFASTDINQARALSELINESNSAKSSSVQLNLFSEVEEDTSSTPQQDEPLQDMFAVEFNPAMFADLTEDLVIKGFTEQRQRIVTNWMLGVMSESLKSKEFDTSSVKSEFTIIKGKLEDALKKFREQADKDARYNKLVSEAELILENINKFRDLTLVQANALFSIQNKDAEEDLTTDDNKLVEPELNEKSEYQIFEDDASLYINHKSKLSKKLKVFFSGIKDAEIKYLDNSETQYSITPKRNYLGMIDYVPYTHVYEVVMKMLEGSEMNKEAILARLKEGENQYPFLSNVITQLEKANGEIINAVQYNMIKHTIQMKYVLRVQTKTDNGIKNTLAVSDSNSSSAAKVILADWQNNMLDAPFIKIAKLGVLDSNVNIGISIDTENEVLTNAIEFFNNARKGILPTPEELVSILGTLGIEIQLNTAIYLQKVGLPNNKGGHRTYDALFKGQGLFSLLGNNLSLLKRDSNIYETGPFNKIRSLFSLAKLDVDFRPKLFTTTFKDGEGKNIWGYSNSRYIVDRLTELKNNPELAESLLNLPFNQDSIFLQALKDKNEKFLEAFDYAYFDVYRDFRSKIGTKMKNQEANQHELSKIALFQNMGNDVSLFSYETLSDKRNMFAISVPRFAVRSSEGSPLSWNNTQGKLNSLALDMLVNGLVAPEVKRIIAHQKQLEENPNYTSNIQNYDKGAMLFYFVPGLNYETDLFVSDSEYELEKDNWTEIPSLLSLDVLSDPAKLSIIKSKVQQQVDSLVEEKLQSWKNEEITINDFDNDYILTRVLPNIREANEENILQYAALDMVVNYLLFNANLHQSFIFDPALAFKNGSSIDNQIKNTFDNLGKRLAADNASGNKLAQSSDKRMKVLIIKDRKVKSSEYASRLGEMNGTDAQSYITDAHQTEILYLKGTITEDTYNQAMKDFKEKGKINFKSLKIVNQPNKPVYVGNVIDQQAQVDKRVYFKMSDFALTSDMVHNTELQKLRDFMIKNGYDRIMTESGVKIGGVSNALQVFDNDGRINLDNVSEDAMNKATLVLPMSNLRIQQEVPYDERKLSINDGTQQRKMLFLNELQNNIFTYNGKKTTGHGLKKEFVQAYSELHKLYFEDLKKKLDIVDGKANISKLQELLIAEGYDRNYFINEIRSLGLNEEKDNFVIPLYFNPSSVKFEALLNSIVDNKIRKIKVTGKSFVLGSQEGFIPLKDSEGGVRQLEDLGKDVRSGIRYTKDFNAETGLRPMRIEDGKVLPAEVLIPFKFKDNQGRSYNIEDFLTKDNLIDYTRLPAELLEMFGYRIPTQKHVSMTYIKVVGFLPAKTGDLIIAPREFTSQMGSDFDVDKLYTMMYSYYSEEEYYDETAEQDKLKKRFEDFISNPSVTKKGRTIIRKNIPGFDLRKAKFDFAGKEKLFYNAKTDTFAEKLKSRKLVKFDFKTLEESKQAKLDLESLDFDLLSKTAAKSKMGQLESFEKAYEASLMNKLVDIHKAVMLAPKMFDTINQSLDYGKLRNDNDTANSFYHILDEIRNTNNSIIGISDEYQKKKYLNAKSSKVAVGAFSSDSVFNATLQRGKTELPIHYGEWILQDKEMVFIETVYKFGNLTSTRIDNPIGADGVTLKSDVIAAWQSAAVDDENQQILGKLNLTTFDLDVIKAINQFGFDESVGVLMINQPIVLEYKKLLAKGDDEFTATNKVLSRYKVGKNLLNTLSTREDFTSPSVETMTNHLTVDYSDIDKVDVQLRAGQVFLLQIYQNLAKDGLKFRALQSRLNTDSKGLSTSIVENHEKYYKILEISKLSNFLNVESLIGNYIPITTVKRTLSQEQIQSYINQGYLYAGDKLIKPNSINGVSSIYSLGINSTLWSNFYPYFKYGYSTAFNTIQTLLNDSVESSSKEFFTTYKAYLFATSQLGFTNNQNPSVLRYEYGYDRYQNINGEDVLVHKSLASIVKQLKTTKLSVNPFINNLETKINKDGTPNTIYLATNSIDETQDMSILKGVISLLSNPVSIGEFNGKEMTTVDLIEQLVASQYMFGGVQEVSQLLKYIPVEYYRAKGIDKLMHNYELNQQDVSNLVTQFIQHNPRLTQEIDIVSHVKRSIKTPNEQIIAFEPKRDLGRFVHLNEVIGEGSKSKNRVSLFEYDTRLKMYVQIDTLGGNGFTEYNPLINVAQSLVPNNKSLVNVMKVNINPEQENEDSFNNDKEVLPPTATSTVYTETNAVDFLLNLLESTTDVMNKNTITQMLDNRNKIKDLKISFQDLGSFGAKYDPVLNVIIINNKKVNSISTQAFQKLVLHEFVHAFVDNKLANPTTKAEKEAVAKLQDLYTKFRLKVDQDKLKELLTKLTKAKRGESVVFDSEETNVLYGATELKEFITLLMTSKEMQSLLNETVDEDNVNFLNKLINAIVELLNSLGFNKGSDLEAGYASVITLINSEVVSEPINVEEFTFNLGENNTISFEEGFTQTFESGEMTKEELMFNCVTVFFGQNPEYIDKLRNITEDSVSGFKNVNLKHYFVQAVKSYYNSYSIVESPLNSSIEEVNEKFGLLSSTGEQNMFSDVRLANILTNMFSNIQVKAVPNKGGYNYDVSYSIDSYSVSGMEKANNLKRNLRTRREQLYKALHQAKLSNNQVLIDSYNNKIMEIDISIKSIDKEITIEDLLLAAQLDLGYLNNTINQNMTLSDINIARNVVHMWMHSVDFFLTESEKESEAILDKFRSIEGTMKNIKERLNKIEFFVMNKFVSESLGKEVKLEEVFSMKKDLSKLQSYTMDISRVDNEMFSAIYKLYKSAMYDAQDEADEISRKINLLVPQVLDEVKSITGKKDFELFMQEFSDGNKTGNLVYRYTQDFFDTKKRMYQGANYVNKTGGIGSAQSWAQYFSFLKKNTITFDVRYLFPTKLGDRYHFAGEVLTDAQIQAHKDELISHIGQKGFDELMSKLENKMSRFVDDYEAFVEYNIEDVNNITEEEKDLLEKWEKENSPYWYSYYSSQNAKTIPQVKGVLLKIKGDKYTYSIPRRFDENNNDLGWYDKKFEAIENNETLLEFYNLMVDTLKTVNKYIPDNKKDRIQVNSLPEIPKTMLEEYMSAGIGGALTPIWDRLKENSRVDDISQYTNKFYDPQTGEVEPQLRIDYVTDRKEKIKELTQLKIAQYQINNDYKTPSAEVVQQFYRESANEIAMQNSPDLAKVIKAYAMMAIGYRHKAGIEDVLKLGRSILHQSKQTEFTPDGLPKIDMNGKKQQLPSSESFSNAKDMYEFFYNTFYGKTRKLEGATKKRVYTKEEKKLKQELENVISESEKAFAEGKISEEIATSLQNNAKEKLDKLGGNLVGSKVGDNFIKYMQYKAMAWNPFSGVSNILFGYVSNAITAADGRDFTRKQFFSAYKLITGSILKNTTFNKVEIGDTKKIRSWMDRLDILKDMSNEVYSTSREQTINNKLKFAEPFNMQKRGEYINQATIMVAMAMNTKLTVDGVETTLYDVMGEDGELMVSNPNEYSEILSKFRMKVDQVIKRAHGNYDTLSPLKLQETIAGRAGIQFRKWMLEGIASRFESEKYDDILEYTRKGRYVTLRDMFWSGKSGVSRKEAFLQSLKWAANRASYGLIKIEENEKISDVDRANMRANMQELVIYLQLISVAILMKSLFEDDEDKRVKNYLLNHLTRVQTDISFYVSPSQFEALTVNPIPVTSLITDAYELIEASGRYLQGDDEIGSGVNKGDSRLLRESLQMLPLGTSIYRNLSATRTEYK